MISLLKHLLQGQGEPPSSIPNDDLNSCIDLAVKQFDSRLSAIPGYRKKLRTPVETALLFLDSLIDRIPGPIEVSKSAYGADPRVHAYFGSFEQIEHLFSHSRTFRDFRQNPAYFGLSHGYALMIMSRQQKRRPGHRLNGDNIQYDVMQEVVVFSEHHLAAPAINERDTRKALRTREFGHLVSEAEKRVAGHTERKAGLQRRRIQLQMKLKSLAAGAEPADPAEEPPEFAGQTAASLSQQLRDTETEISKASQSFKTINDYLDLLAEVIGNPAECCSLSIQSDYLNRANVMVEEGSGNEIPYAEIRIGETRHHWVIVKYPLSEAVEQSSTADLFHAVYDN
ncbi:MAG: hypothetical protein H6968_05225 [Chromatiaceae bacterium]|nr:hypothetical protein [Chromatiaceae bacterium]